MWCFNLKQKKQGGVGPSMTQEQRAQGIALMVLSIITAMVTIL